jgi:hypothetical protein
MAKNGAGRATSPPSPEQPAAGPDAASTPPAATAGPRSDPSMGTYRGRADGGGEVPQRHDRP